MGLLVSCCIVPVAIVYYKGLETACPFIYRLLFSPRNELIWLKICVSFLFGMLLGLALYEGILVDLEMEPIAVISLGGFLTFLIAIGNAISIQIRCISALTVPTLLGRVGRGVLRTLAMAYVLAGPVHNTLTNGKEIVRVFTCSTALTANLTKARILLMVEPFQQALFGMKADMSEIKDTARSVQEAINPLVGEIEGEEEMRRMKEENDYIDEKQDDSKRSEEIERKYRGHEPLTKGEKYEIEYQKKLESRCEDMLSKGTGKCRKMFSDTYDKCYNKVSFLAAWLLCWPMKLTFVCNILEAFGGKACDPSGQVEPGVGEAYGELKYSPKELMEDFQGAHLQYKLDKQAVMVNVFTAQDTVMYILNNVQQKRDIIDKVIQLFQRVLAFVFIRVILSAQKYHDNYLNDVTYDNIYVTNYFKRIDKRREQNNQHQLLPFKKSEVSNYVFPSSIQLTASEKGNLMKDSLSFLLEVMIATIFILLDYLLYEAMDLLHRHAAIEFHEKGFHELSLKVKGTGLIARLVRSVLKGFNIRKNINYKADNYVCLPQPKKLLPYYLYKIYGTFLLVFIFTFCQAYSNRLRRLICSYFYPKREKERVLYLFNDALKKRKLLFKFMKSKVKRMAKQNTLEIKESFLLGLRVKYPQRFEWLRIFKGARRRCLICEEPESCRKTEKSRIFHFCATPLCYFVYCIDCWKDVGEICFACAPMDELDEDENDYYD